MLNFKVILVGDADTGKTKYVDKLVACDTNKDYIPTEGCQIKTLRYRSSDEKTIQIHIWDCAGDEKYEGLGDGYYINANAAIVMFDHENKLSFDGVKKWIKNVRRVVSDVPIVICGNHAAYKRTISKRQIRKFESAYNVKYLDIQPSNLHNPLYYIMKNLLMDASLKFFQETCLDSMSFEKESRDICDIDQDVGNNQDLLDGKDNDKQDSEDKINDEDNFIDLKQAPEPEKTNSIWGWLTSFIR